MTIPFHPLANLFPMMSEREQAELADDMRANGFRYDEPIVLHQGGILDGRNRYRAAVAAGLFPADVDPAGRTEFLAFGTEGGLFDQATVDRGPLAYVISKNLHRRHLNESQRAMVAAKLATMQHGGDRRSDQAAHMRLVPQAKAAATLSVSERMVNLAKLVQGKGAPELVSAVEQGKLAVTAAAKAAQLAPDLQREIAARADAGDGNAAKTVIKQHARAAREAALGARICELPQQRFGVIYADPEWKFEVWGDGGMDRHPANHYPVSDTETIAARDIASIAAADCVLALWATAPMLPDALQVMAEWGFAYKTHVIWRKPAPITGYWFRSVHELLLIGTRGNPPAPAPGTQSPSVIDAPSPGRHSAKPELFLAMVEQLFPTLPKIELNRRGPPRPGWSAWGNEATPPSSSDAAAGGEVRDDGATHDDTETTILTNAQSPSNRDASTGGEPSSGAGPQAEAPHAGIGSETPADREGHSEGAPVRSHAGLGPGPAPHPDYPPGEHPLDIPDFLLRRPAPAAEAQP